MSLLDTFLLESSKKLLNARPRALSPGEGCGHRGEGFAESFYRTARVESRAENSLPDDVA